MLGIVLLQSLLDCVIIPKTLAQELRRMGGFIMSKVICDVCGTTYPETSAHCPICNSAKNSVDQTAAGTTGEMGEGSYAYVKGGRFSKKNVRKRSKGSTTAQQRSSRQSPDKEEPSNTGLVVTVVLLLLAVVAVVIYIGVRFLGSGSSSNVGESTGGQTQTQLQTQEQTQATEDKNAIRCEDLKISAQIVELMAEGDTWTLVVSLTPIDTTEEVGFGTSNPDVATVSADGIVTAVGSGEAEITVTCGEVYKTCKVICSFEEPEPSTEPSESTQPSTEPVEPGEFDFKFNTAFTDETTGYGDCTLGTQGKVWTAYKSSLAIDPSLITWKSDDESVCTVENGIVTAVGNGKTLIHATYNGVTYSCIIRCPFKETAGENSGSTETTKPEETTGSCKISHSDVTIAVGESFKLTLKDSSGKAVEVTWTASGDGVTIDGNKITGAKSGTVKVTATYEDVTYTCIVRVK